MRNQKGITLVALIITIIVMVILAGVAISMAIGDNGVIEKTQGAIKEQERANVQDIIIASYIYKVAGATNTFAYIDIPKTGIAIFENLEANGFKVLEPDVVENGNGEMVNSAPLVKDESTGEYTGIEVTVKGDHGEYFGKVESSGLVGAVIEKEIVEEIPDSPVELTDLERLIAYFKDEVILDSSTGLGLVNTSTGKFDQAKEGILTSEQAQSIIFTPLEEIPPVGILTQLPIKYNSVNYILTMITVKEDEIEKIKGVSVSIYEQPETQLIGAYTIANGLGTEIHFHSNGMFRLLLLPTYQGQAAYTGTYTVNESEDIINVSMIAKETFGDEDWIFDITDDELNTISLTIDNESLSGNWSKVTQSSYAYNPELHEKGFYINAIYANYDEDNNLVKAISTSSTYIFLEQSRVGQNGETEIKIQNFDPNATDNIIELKNEGTIITYNGEDYRLISVAEMNEEE